MSLSVPSLRQAVLVSDLGPGSASLGTITTVVATWLTIVWIA